MASRRSSIEGRHEGGGKGGAIAVVIAIVLIGLVIFAMSSRPQEKPAGAEGILDAAADNLNNISRESFTFDGAIETKVGGSNKGVTFSGEGRIDPDVQKMHFKANFELAGIMQDAVMDLESYTMGKDVYFKFKDQWMVARDRPISWENVGGLSRKLVQLVRGLDPSVKGVEKVNGRDAFKIEASPSIGDLVKIVDAASPGFIDRMGIADVDTLGQNVKELTITMYVDSERMLPVKMDVYMVAEVKSLNSDNAGVIRSDMVLSGTVNFDYDTPFRIVLPSAAESLE